VRVGEEVGVVDGFCVGVRGGVVGFGVEVGVVAGVRDDVGVAVGLRVEVGVGEVEVVGEVDIVGEGAGLLACMLNPPVAK
jgi:hypothetical protein